MPQIVETHLAQLVLLEKMREGVTDIAGCNEVSGIIDAHKPIPFSVVFRASSFLVIGLDRFDLSEVGHHLVGQR